MSDNKKKSTTIAPSLIPRKTVKKSIPGKKNNIPPNPLPSAKETELQQEKKRFTLWINPDVYNAFKLHVATKDGSASSYIEDLIRTDLKL